MRSLSVTLRFDDCHGDLAGVASGPVNPSPNCRFREFGDTSVGDGYRHFVPPRRTADGLLGI